MNTPGVVDGVMIRAVDEPPRAAILSVGTELLLGDVVDTNTTWIRRRLTELGVELVHHLTIGDDLEALVDAIRWLVDRSHLVVIGGGLGPTTDDLTRDAVAEAAGVALEERDELVALITQRFARMGRPMATENLRQARVPVGATAFPPAGTAPAFALTVDRPSPARVVALPGVPWEMRELWEKHVVDEVAAIAGKRVITTRILRIVGPGESDIASTVEPIVAGHDEVTLAFLATGSSVEIRLTTSGPDRDSALAASRPLVDRIDATFGAAVVSIDDDTLEQVVVRRLREVDQTLATGESATGGDIAARLARVNGAGDVLAGGASVYSPEAKTVLLGVPEDLVATRGTVSEEVTAALAKGARDTLHADWGLAVTGVAGPASVDGLPIGTSYWALAHPDGEVEVHTRVLPGDRLQVIERLGTLALNLLRQRLAEQ